MASPESGTAVAPDPPEEPAEALDACEADPTEASTAAARSRQRRTESPESVEVGDRPHEDAPPQEVEEHWIGVELVDDHGDPVPDEPYKVKLPDGSIQTGRLDAKGRAKIEGITESGQAEISFPGLYGDEWKPV
ncbi:MAG: hypothetical protein IT437_11935 [Phycisphaerales bacterium]|nr:hypothetical protein [Phycisphaerales bacterium]